MKRLVFAIVMIVLVGVSSCGVKKTSVLNEEKSPIVNNDNGKDVVSDSVDIEYEVFKRILAEEMLPDDIIMPIDYSYYKYPIGDVCGDVETITSINYNISLNDSILDEAFKNIGDTLELIVYSFNQISDNEIEVEERHHNFLDEYFYNLLTIPFYDCKEKFYDGTFKIVSKYNNKGQLVEANKYNKFGELVSKTKNIISRDGVIVETLTLDTIVTNFYDNDKYASISIHKSNSETRTKYSYDSIGNCVKECQYVFGNDTEYNTANVTKVNDSYYLKRSGYKYEYETMDVVYDDDEKYSKYDNVRTYNYDDEGRCVSETFVEYHHSLSYNLRYNIFNQTETIYKYEDNGNLVEKNTYRDNKLYQKLMLKYDNADNVIEARTYTYYNDVEQLAEMIKFDIKYKQ